MVFPLAAINQALPPSAQRILHGKWLTVKITPVPIPVLFDISEFWAAFHLATCFCDIHKCFYFSRFCLWDPQTWSPYTYGLFAAGALENEENTVGGLRVNGRKTNDWRVCRASWLCLYLDSSLLSSAGVNLQKPVWPTIKGWPPQPSVPAAVL